MILNRIAETFGRTPLTRASVHETLKEFKNLLSSIGYSIRQAAFDRPPDNHGWIVAQYR